MAFHSALRPRRVMARTLLLGTSALLAAGLLTWSPTQTTGWSQGAAEGTLWQLLNGARVNNGMAPLQYHATLQGIARWRSADMLSRNYFSHTIPGCGCEVYTYYDANGVNYVWGGENIGWNSGLSDASSPITVHENFMASAGHRANVLNPSFTHGAVGAAAADNQMFLGYVQNTRMYTELFAQVPGAAAPAPAPAPARAPAPAPSQPRASGGSAPRAAAPAAAAPAAQREPEPAKVAVEAPRRPASAAGIDGVGAVVSAPRTSLAPRLMIDETAAARAAAMETSDKPASVAMTRGLQVVAAPAETGALDDVVGALLDFILG